MKPKYAIALLAVGLLLLSQLYSATQPKRSAEPALQPSTAPALTPLPTSIQTSVVAQVKKACYCTCTANDGSPSGGQVFEHPGSQSSCSSYNGNGCNIEGENGTLSECRAGPIPIGTELLPPM